MRRRLGREGCEWQRGRRRLGARRRGDGLAGFRDSTRERVSSRQGRSADGIGPTTTVTPRQCVDGKVDPGGGQEMSTSQPVPFWIE